MAEIITIHGPIEEMFLEKREGSESNENADAHWVEYWLADELVHRSVEITIKKGIVYPFEQGKLN